MIAIYIIALFVGEIGYCVLLVIASKKETKVRAVLPYAHPVRDFRAASHHQGMWRVPGYM